MNESSKFPTIFFFVVVILVVPILAVGAYTVYNYFNNGSQEASEASEEVEEEILLIEEDDEDVKYEDLTKKDLLIFGILPPDLDAIVIPPPPDSVAADTAHYNSVKPAAGSVTEEDVSNDTVYNFFVIENLTYGELVNNGTDMSFKLWGYHDELRLLTKKFNDMYGRPSLSQRVGSIEGIGVIEPAIYEDETESVYPSVRAVEGFLVGEVLAALEPENAVMHREAGEAHAMRGITYGHYGLSDVEASRSLVEQYLQTVGGLDLETN